MRYQDWVPAIVAAELRRDELLITRVYRIRKDIDDSNRYDTSQSWYVIAGLTARISIWPPSNGERDPLIVISIDRQNSGTISNPFGEMSPEEILKVVDIRRSIDRWVQGEAELPPSDVESNVVARTR